MVRYSGDSPSEAGIPVSAAANHLEAPVDLRRDAFDEANLAADGFGVFDR